MELLDLMILAFILGFWYNFTKARRRDAITIRTPYDEVLLVIPREVLTSSELESRLFIKYPNRDFTWNHTSMDILRNGVMKDTLVVYETIKEEPCI